MQLPSQFIVYGALNELKNVSVMDTERLNVMLRARALALLLSTEQKQDPLYAFNQHCHVNYSPWGLLCVLSRMTHLSPSRGDEMHNIK